MARPAKPFFRKQTQSWYCSLSGKQFSLGKDKQLAFQKFHELMANREEHLQNRFSLYELSQAYLDWCQANRKPATYKLHRHFLKSFIEAVGRRLQASQLKIHQVTKWHEGLGVSSTTQNDAVAIMQRMLNWAVEQSYISRNPITGMKKPKRKRRDVYYTAEQWAQIREHANGSLVDLLDFLYCTGCRPQEARLIESRHIHNDLVIFPSDESKGQNEPRVIYLAPKAKTIIDNQLLKFPEGPLFRNERGVPWTKNAIVLRLRRISEKIGFRVIAYGARHSWATEALMNGGVDPISVALLMGHKDTTMVSRVYSHLAKNPVFLRQQAHRATPTRNHEQISSSAEPPSATDK
ncbi:tyrosine-type recombinase/integrase [Rubinisphaera margarita]|uniref:tyrosine-type recombinase/integrase n=1 Tax=Rubinisphaera margarita TaxID=2909586 RepID=UPI001EE8D941|nr:tyrosine-type recombinase/integrase [Rubinisphaera margarita]MCG6154190.1 tyrosine-type recombinase/integrase [Rubinisphaera margarita]